MRDNSCFIFYYEILLALASGPVIQNPCVPSPCGPYAECRDIGGVPSCSCLKSYIGSPPNCRPECTINSDCVSNQACINERCRDPCPGSCGLAAICNVINHTPACTCPEGFTGDPFNNCYLKRKKFSEKFDWLFTFLFYIYNQNYIISFFSFLFLILLNLAMEDLSRPADPCNPSPCGPNALCIDGSCSCLSDYQGDPYIGCRPECVLNNDCSLSRACIRNKCVDPCPGTCGENAQCNVYNHIPMCSCLPGMTGNAFLSCRPSRGMSIRWLYYIYVEFKDFFSISSILGPENPCNPSPCGSNSICRVINEQAVCSCVPSFIGTPPSCRPECTVSSDCPKNQACSNQRCINPCAGSCGVMAKCQVINHNPICNCPAGFTGDPFVRCEPKSEHNFVNFNHI